MKSKTTLDESIIFSTQYKHHYIRKDEPYCTECILKFIGKNGNIFVCYGYSIASEGRPFNRKIGRTIAHGRAEKLALLLWNYGNANEENEKVYEFCSKQRVRDIEESVYPFPNYERLFNFTKTINQIKADYKELTPDEFEQEHSAMVAL